QDLSATPMVVFTIPGTYSVTTTASVTVRVSGVAGGGGGGGTPNNTATSAGTGGGGGASDVAGEFVTLVPGKTDTAIVGAGGASATRGGTTSFKNMTDALTYLDLGGGSGGIAAGPSFRAGGAGGVVSVGTNAIAGGVGGAFTGGAGGAG